MAKRREATVFTAILCLMVIYIHVTSEAVAGYDKTGLLYAFAFVTNKLCTFVVPAFIFVSSLKYFMGFSYNKAFSYPKFLANRTLKIYLPYVMWVVIYYVYFVYARNYFPFSFRDLGHYVFFGDISAPFYFVVIIMQFYLLMPLWRKIGRIKKTAGIFAVIVVSAAVSIFMTVYANGVIAELFNKPGFVIPYNDRIFTSYLPYWTAGVFCGLHYDSVVAFLKKYRLPLFMFCVFVAAAHIVLCYKNSVGAFNYSFAEQGQMLFNILALLSLYLLCVLINEGASRISAFSIADKLAGASFYIYLSHCLVLVHTEYMLETFHVASVSLRLLAKFATVFTIPVILSILYISLKTKIRTGNAGKLL